MSRRDDRSSDARRHRSRFDREPSPKRSRRDDNKPERERPPVDTKDRDSDKKHHRQIRDPLPLESATAHDSKIETRTMNKDTDKKHHRQLRDPLPLESASAHDSKIETRTMNKDTDSRINAPPEITKKSSDPTKVPQPRTNYQHGDRAGVGQNGRTFNRGRTDKEHGSWRDSKEDRNNRTEVKEKVASDVKEKVATDVKDEKPKDGRDENQAWRNKGDFQMEINPARKRPAFREHKLPAVDSEKTATVQDSRHGGVESGRRSERRFHSNSERSGRHERSFTRDRESTRGEQAWSNSRDRYGGGRSGYRGAGREGFNVGQQGYNRLSGGSVEKWKHDLYDEANKSPKAKNEEDRILKIEALLAS